MKLRLLSGGEAIALPRPRDLGLAPSQTALRRGQCPSDGLRIARQEVLRGFRVENRVWALVAACALALLVASALG